MSHRIIGFILLFVLSVSITACSGSNNWETVNYTDEEIKSYTESFNEGHMPWRADPLEVVSDFFHRKSNDSEFVSSLINMDNMIVRYNVDTNKYLELKPEYIDQNHDDIMVTKYRYVDENSELPDWTDTQYRPEYEPYAFWKIQDIALDFIESQLDETEYNNIIKTELYLRFENSQNILDCLVIQPTEDSIYWLVKQFLISDK